MGTTAWTSIAGRQVVQITTVDPPSRKIEGRLRDGTVIPIALSSTDVLFRWPKQGEVWYVQYTDRGPVLDSYLEQVDSPFPIENLAEGEARIDTEKLNVSGSLNVIGELTKDGEPFVGQQGPPGEPSTVPGPPGPAGPPGDSAAEYVHVQLVPAAEVIVDHGLGTIPAVVVIVSDGTEFEGGYEHPDNNTTIISFSGPQSFTAYFKP